MRYFSNTACNILDYKIPLFLIKEYKNVKSAFEEMKEEVLSSFSNNQKGRGKLVGVF